MGINNRLYFIMGVSGSGKTSVGRALAADLDIPFFDADDFHPPENRAKMAQGIPLTDADRQPWLEALHAAAQQALRDFPAAVFACSALKEQYRQVLMRDMANRVQWVYLKGDPDTISKRIAARKGHFMPAALLQSQFDTLEEPAYGIHLDIREPIAEIIKRIKMAIQNRSDFGLVGLGVMGKSLARNFANKGIKMSLYNRFVAGSEEQVAERFIAAYPELKDAQGFEDIGAFIASLERPRKVFLMIKAGAETDEFIEKLLPFLSENDIVIDGGNAHFEDTRRRIAYLKTKQVDFIGAGVSGGEYGALHGPSIMPSGDLVAYKHLEPFLQAIAARDNEGKPCCAYIGKDGAGHFIKMVHNGIEYAEMQLIAETYGQLRFVHGLAPEAISELFTEWAEGDLKSYLLEITAKILLKKEGGGYLLDQILDKAGNKGTGNWATVTASELGMPATMITAALFARYLSTIKEQYPAMQESPRMATMAKPDVQTIREACQVARILNHQQGFALMQVASATYGWNLNFTEIARIWTNGCIIRSTFMETLRQVFRDSGDILADQRLRLQVKNGKPALKQCCISGLQHDLPMPCHQAALEYLNTLEARFPTANVIQAQRDFFGAHTYQRVDDPGGRHFHTEWED